MNLQTQTKPPLQLWKWTNKLTGHEQCRRHLSIKPSQDKLRWWWEARCNPPRISQNTPASSIFDKTSSHISNKDQDDRMPPHHGIHSLSMVYLRCLVRPWMTMNTQKTPLSHWRWSLHANSNEVPSLIIKIAGVSLTNKEELSATPLEDKDNQGETLVYISNAPQLVNQKWTKIKKGWWKKSMRLSVSSSLGLRLNTRKGPT